MKKWFLMPLAAAFFFYSFTIKSIDKPKLVVFISVDQGMPSLLKKYDHLFYGGLRWLMDHGIQFENVFHNHGHTVTGPGHYSIVSGRYPGKEGIIANEWYDRNLNRVWYCVEDTTAIELSDSSTGRSYKNINVTALGDWLKESTPNSKIVSISGKDRAAVFMGGKNPNMVLWDDRMGSYTTSTYYSDSLPLWVKEETKKRNIPAYRDSIWNRILPEKIYNKNTRDDYTYGEADYTMKNGYSPIFPIKFDEVELSEFLGFFYSLPYGDELTIQLGKKAIEIYEMGMDSYIDILFLGLSATDGIGHSFGPHSHEQMDNYLRLDKQLGILIQSLEKSIGKGNVLYILTSDHGAVDLPEYARSQGKDAGRIQKATRNAMYESALKEIESKIGPNQVIQYGNNFYYNEKMGYFAKRRATKILKNTFLKIPGVSAVLTREEILRGGDSELEIRLNNMIHPQKSPDVYLIPKKYWTWRYQAGSSHGTHYDYDAHVPFIIAKGGGKGKSISKKVFSVDIAPTVAKLLGVPYPDDLDGKPIPIKN